MMRLVVEEGRKKGEDSDSGSSLMSDLVYLRRPSREKVKPAEPLSVFNWVKSRRGEGGWQSLFKVSLADVHFRQCMSAVSSIY